MMFLNVISRQGKKARFVECVDMTIISQDEGRQKFLVIENARGQERTIEINEGTEAYLMNEMGKTIEHFLPERMTDEDAAIQSVGRSVNDIDDAAQLLERVITRQTEGKPTEDQKRWAQSLEHVKNALSEICIASDAILPQPEK